MCTFESSSSVYEVWAESAVYRKPEWWQDNYKQFVFTSSGFLECGPSVRKKNHFGWTSCCLQKLWHRAVGREHFNKIADRAFKRSTGVTSVITQETSCQVLWLHNKQPECSFSKAKLAQTTLFTRLIHYTSHFYKDAVRLSGLKETGTTVLLSCSHYGNLWSCSLAARHWSEMEGRRP